MSNARTHLPLITKHRPKVFADVIGLPDVTNALEQSILEGDIANAYLLVGSSGGGKTTIARIIARTVMCETRNACGTCASCLASEDFGSHPDYQELNCGENGKIDEIRRIISTSHNSPILGGMRVIILDEAHRLTGPSLEALLKPLEEPAEKTLWILCTTETQSLKDTIKNRCNIIPIKPVDPATLAKYLFKLSKKELGKDFNKTVMKPVSIGIADMTGGYIRSALSTLDLALKLIRNESEMEAEDIIAKIQESIIKNTDANQLAAQQLVIAVLAGDVKGISHILANHGDFFSLSKGILNTVQYCVDVSLGASGANVYHPPYLRATWSEIKAANTGNAGILISLLDVAVELQSDMAKFLVPERNIISSRLLKAALKIRASKKD